MFGFIQRLTPRYCPLLQLALASLQAVTSSLGPLAVQMPKEKVAVKFTKLDFTPTSCQIQYVDRFVGDTAATWYQQFRL